MNIVATVFFDITNITHTKFFILVESDNEEICDVVIK